MLHNCAQKNMLDRITFQDLKMDRLTMIINTGSQKLSLPSTWIMGVSEDENNADHIGIKKDI